MKWLIILAFLTPAHAHMANSGWEYSSDCCSEKDCKVLSTNLVQATQYGWRLVWRNEMIPFGDTRIRKSQDTEFHLCTVNGRMDTPLRCLYVPNMGG